MKIIIIPTGYMKPNETPYLICTYQQAEQFKKSGIPSEVQLELFESVNKTVFDPLDKNEI